MKLTIKDLYVEMEIKTRGMEIEVRGTSNRHLGDLRIKKGGLEWCKGRAQTGVKVQWSTFIEFMESRQH